MKNNTYYFVTGSLYALAVLVVISALSPILPKPQVANTSSTKVLSSQSQKGYIGKAQLAASLSYAFATQTPSDLLKYDLNTDGKITFYDVAYVADYINGREYNDKFDFNKDKAVDFRDLALIQIAIGSNPIYRYDHSEDGKITFYDVAYVADYINGREYNANYDYNADGVVDYRDLAPIRKTLLTSIDAYDHSEDGKITFYDVAYVADYINGREYNANYDYNADGVVDYRDLAPIRKTTVRWVDAYDFNEDGKVDATDVLYPQDAVNSNSYNANFDFNADGLLNSADVSIIQVASLTCADGDMNKDGKVTVVDMEYVRSKLGIKLNSSGWDPKADLNKSGFVNATDVTIERQLIINCN